MAAAARPFSIGSYNQPQPGPRFVSERDLQEITGVSVRSWQKWRLLGKGPKFYKVGSNVRYNLDEVLAFIQAGAVEPGPR